MARAINRLKPEQCDTREPLYDIDPPTGAAIEVFYGDRALAKCFGMRSAGWFWWTCQRGCLPDTSPAGPFATSYSAYRDAAACGGTSAHFGKRKEGSALSSKYRTDRPRFC
jgi:hypothetical protein